MERVIFMDSDIERNMGPQPIAVIMESAGLSVAELVHSSSEQITFKMVQRAMKGRRLTPHVQLKILRALESALHKEFKREELFNY